MYQGFRLVGHCTQEVLMSVSSDDDDVNWQPVEPELLILRSKVFLLFPILEYNINFRYMKQINWNDVTQFHSDHLNS